MNEVRWWIYVYLRSLVGYAMTVIGDTLQKNHGTINIFFDCVLTTPTTWDENIITTFGVIARGAIKEACQSSQVQAYGLHIKSFHYNITEPEAVGAL